MTLHTFKKDTPDTSSCEGTYGNSWPPFHQEMAETENGLAAGNFGTILRPEGKKDTVYKGMPLYYCIKDAKPAMQRRME